ncbi:hypothetical protein QQS21_000936 [Conoideocrella luteorostrata]|uniref:Peroxin 20 n=1 Tax=Conoideocrella luteorostrata TaxID=1105319 RepID=A0AAJ0CXY0_9HYPO|nr:hypothetical protein QQS21_000936 [Conoideocrella luteorostrata]
MADASCSGPSPFKRLVDHQSRDVSHHQDRLVDRSAGQAHGAFRSSRQQPHGQDNFGAFMDGTTSAMPGMPHDPAIRLAVHAAALQQPIAPIHNAETLQQARASPAPDVANWAADFTRFSNQQMRSSPNVAASAPAMHINQQPMQMNFQSAFGQAFGGPMYGPGAGFVGTQATPGTIESDFDQEMSQWMANHGGRNMSEVDAAMDQMARELELNEATLPAEAAEATAQEATSSSSARYTDLETPEIGNLSLHENLPEQIAASTDEQAIHDDAAAKGKSAVSEAAERLLESVQHENGEKWQNSVFLSLMRDFRDGRKDIVNDEICAMDGETEGQQQQATT